jgi:hypothetical protein
MNFPEDADTRGAASIAGRAAPARLGTSAALCREEGLVHHAE